MTYTASTSQTQGRPGYAILFRHPLRLDKKGKPGLRVRRGLNTSNESTASALVAQMNEILADESWWNSDRRNVALTRFDAVVVEAFYDGIQAGQEDSRAIRDKLLPIPGREEGYARVLFVGTTGAGKTSLLRHFIGSDPDEDRFPSTSTAKTTVSDIEVIPTTGSYRAAVTFFSEFVTQANVEDCVLSACSAIWEKQADDKVMERLLNHPDQRFRLSYTLGSWKGDASAEIPDDEWSFGDEEAQSNVDQDAGVSATEARDNKLALEGYLTRMRALSDGVAAQLVAEFGEPGHLSSEDAAAAFDLFQEQVEDAAEFAHIVQDIMEAIAARFTQGARGELHDRTKTLGWPSHWTYETDSREEFVRQIRWFSSNFAPSFGKLLTPLVDGIRVFGPMFPAFTDSQPKMVLIDGQGLGHTAESSASVTTHITRRFAEVDVILLVDSAQQPIQAAAQAVLRAAASSGHYGKLAVAFTHFDQVKGANLPTVADKRAHVLASLTNYLQDLKEVLSAAVVAAMSRALESQSFMLGALQISTRKLPKGVVSELSRLVEFFEASIVPPPEPETHPIFDPSGIGFAVQKATSKFQRHWSARLNLAVTDRVSPEHWTRIKALTRRIGGELDVEYASLRPVADMVARMSEEISNFLDNPIAWTRKPISDEEAQQALSAIRRAVFTDLHDVLINRMIASCLARWRTARDESGTGSARRRSQTIKAIYETAVPVPGVVNEEDEISLLRDVQSIVFRAIQSNGGELRLAGVM